MVSRTDSELDVVILVVSGTWETETGRLFEFRSSRSTWAMWWTLLQDFFNEGVSLEGVVADVGHSGTEDCACLLCPRQFARHCH